MRAWILLALACCATPPTGTFVEKHSYPCRSGVCIADDQQLAEVAGQRRQLSDRAKMCRAGSVGPQGCQTCMEAARATMVDAGLAPEVEDRFEPERRCW